MPLLSQRETLILDHISRRSSISQRELAKETKISLGLINVILKKMVNAGYIRVTHLNRRKMEYVLTYQGFKETTKRAYHYVTRIIRNYKIIEANLSNLLKELHKSGYSYFSIHGDGELRDLTESVFQNCLEEAPVTLGREYREDQRAVILNLTTDAGDPNFKGDVVNVLGRICQKFEEGMP